MTDKAGRPARKNEPTTAEPSNGAALTEAQRTFAALLGRLLAQRWQERQRAQQADVS